MEIIVESGPGDVCMMRQTSESSALDERDITNGLDEAIDGILVLAAGHASALNPEAITRQEGLFVLLPDVLDGSRAFVIVLFADGLKEGPVEPAIGITASRTHGQNTGVSDLPRHFMRRPWRD